MSISVWSLDDGYGDIKGYNGRKRLIVPSHCTGWVPPQKMELGDGEELDLQSHIGAEVDGSKYLVGKGAMEQDTKLTWVGGNNKHLDKNFPILLKTALGIMAEYDNVILDPLVMGLPVRTDEDENRHKLLSEIARGEHRVKVTLADGRETERVIYVKDVIIKKQPFGSFCDVILDETGEVCETAIASQFNVIVDIGARTLNVYTLDALEPIYKLSDTTNHGMYTAYQWVGDYIAQNLGTPVSSGRLPLIIQREEIRGTDLRPVIQACYESLANEIHRVIETMFADSWAYVDRVIVTGGGSEVLKTWLELAFHEKNPMFLDRFATARGLRKYGLREAKRRGKVVMTTGNVININVGSHRETLQ